jgi:hypothetical protein
MRRSLRVAGSQILPFLALALLAHAPHIAIVLTSEVAESQALFSALEFQLLDIVLAQLLGAAVAYTTVLALRGTPVGIVHTLHVVMSRMFPIVAVGLISQVSVVLINIEPLFSLVGILITVILFVAVPIVVLEQPGIAESLRRSARLTYGRRWNILGLLGVFVLITLVFDQLFRLIFGPQGELLDPSYVVALAVFRACLAVFGSVVSAVTYLELRRMHAEAYRRGL